jgi:glycosyltransferase involved in cell wall biosynthesis
MRSGPAVAPTYYIGRGAPSRRSCLRTMPLLRTSLARLSMSIEGAAVRAVRSVLVRHVRAQPRPADLPGAERRVSIILVSAWGMGGTIRAALNLAGYLADHYEVEIISVFRRRDESFFGAFPPGVKVTALDDQRPEAIPRGLRGRVRELLRTRASVLMHPIDHAAGEFNLWIDVRLARKLHRKTGYLITTRPGLNLLAGQLSPPGLVRIGQEQMHLGNHNKRLRKAMPRHYPKLDALAVLTDRDMAAYEELLDGAAANGRPRLARIPNTVREMGGAKADLSSKTILAAGRLTPQKGFDLLIRAYPRVAAAHPDWHLRICGRGDGQERLEELIAEHGVGEHVTLAGPAEQLGDDMEAASVFVLSSRFEGFPLVLLEAMSKGMAAVAFDCPTGPADIIEDHRNGILVPLKDLDALADGIIEMIEDEELRRRCAAAAVETASRYTMEQIGPHWDELLRELPSPGAAR